MRDTDPYRSVRQVAELWGTSQDVVRSHIHSGALPASDIATSPGKKRWRIRQADLDAFLAARRNVPPPKPVRRPRRQTDRITQYY